MVDTRRQPLTHRDTSLLVGVRRGTAGATFTVSGHRDTIGEYHPQTSALSNSFGP